MFSYQQFQQLEEMGNYHPTDENGHPEDAGFSVRPGPANTLTRASDAYMVGSNSRYTRNPANADDIASYTEEHKEQLSDPSKYLGGWWPAGRERGELDVSSSFPRDVGGALAAHHESALQNQEAVGEVDRMGAFVAAHPTVNPLDGIPSEVYEAHRQAQGQ